MFSMARKGYTTGSFNTYELGNTATRIWIAHLTTSLVPKINPVVGKYEDERFYGYSVISWLHVHQNRRNIQHTRFEHETSIISVRLTNRSILKQKMWYMTRENCKKWISFIACLIRRRHLNLWPCIFWINTFVAHHNEKYVQRRFFLIRTTHLISTVPQLL